VSPPPSSMLTARPEEIADRLRARIVDGVYPPGGRMPSRIRLTREFGASTSTVQRALDRLAQEGFVRSRPRGGTFVAAEPPHVGTYALVFSTQPAENHTWHASRFWTVLSDEAGRMQGQGGRTLQMYMGVREDEPGEDYWRLEADVRARRVAGVIATVPWPMLGLMRGARVPCVAMYHSDDLPGILPVNMSQAEWLAAATEYLAARHRRRVGVILPSHLPEEFCRGVVDAIEARAMRTHPRWIQGVDVARPHWARSCAEMLARERPDEAPDALLICDDTLAEHAVAGLVDAGVRVPEQLEVVCHSNFPNRAPRVLPVQRLGFDVPELLRTCIDVIDRAAAGEKITGITRVPVRFEDGTAALTAAAKPARRRTSALSAEGTR